MPKPEEFGPLGGEYKIGNPQSPAQTRRITIFFNNLQIISISFVAAAVHAGARTPYPGNVQPGQAIDGLTIRNPFRRWRADHPSGLFRV